MFTVTFCDLSVTSMVGWWFCVVYLMHTTGPRSCAVAMATCHSRCHVKTGFDIDVIIYTLYRVYMYVLCLFFKLTLYGFIYTSHYVSPHGLSARCSCSSLCSGVDEPDGSHRCLANWGLYALWNIYTNPNCCHKVGSAQLFPVKGMLNATGYEDIWDNWMLPTLRQQFGKALCCSSMTVPLCTKQGP